MLIEFIGGKLDGMMVRILFVDNAMYIPINQISKDGKMFSLSDTKLGNADQLVYRRKPDTNKFYFDKIEEV